MRKMFSENQLKDMTIKNVNDAIESGAIDIPSGTSCHAYHCYTTGGNAGISFVYVTDADNLTTEAQIANDMKTKGFISKTTALPSNMQIYKGGTGVVFNIGIYSSNGSTIVCYRAIVDTSTFAVSESEATYGYDKIIKLY